MVVLGLALPELMNALKQVSSSHWSHFTAICKLRMVDRVCAS